MGAGVGAGVGGAGVGAGVGAKVMPQCFMTAAATVARSAEGAEPRPRAV